MRTLNEVIAEQFPTLVGLPNDRGDQGIIECKPITDRLKWIAFLVDPARRKFCNQLADERIVTGAEPKRCCLGHGCAALLDPEDWEAGEGTSEGLAELVEMHNREGGTFDKTMIMHHPYANLVEVNDHTDATPQDIGRYLLTVIRGGDSTPFKTL